MVPPTQNRLLPLLVSVVLAALVFVALKSWRQNGPEAPTLTTVPIAPAADADTPADTIKTLTANVASMTTALETLRQDNATLKKENQALLSDRSQMEQRLSTRIDQTLTARAKKTAAEQAEGVSALSALNARVDALADSLTNQPGASQDSDIPIGLGLDDASTLAEPLTWIEPLDAAAEATAKAGGVSGLTRSWTEGVGAQTDALARDASQKIDSMIADPVYTVPRNATLIGSTAMTALVGRIPVQGQVRDPMPFKVITGAENLAANGLTVPGVHGMIWSGTAVGDWTLACVTGRLDSVTFVFDDGTIRTISSDDRELQGGDRTKPIAWISDAQGIPCVSGERKTNAPAFLTQRIGVMAIGAAADAAAAAETTTVVTDTGGINSSVTGNTGPYVLGKAVSGGSDEIAKWLMERQAQSFDAVFVPAGVPLAIHVDRELLIDFDRNGRRLSHARSADSTVYPGLD